MGQLDGKVAIITGGESGIGLATTRRFVAEGAKVHVIGIDSGKLDDLSKELGESVSTAVADVADEDALKAAVDAGAQQWGTVDVLFSNAGIAGQIGPIVEQDSAGFARVLAVHVLGGFHAIKHTTPHLADGASIIIMSSAGGLVGMEGAAPYISAKHALVGLMRTAAVELAPRRIRVNSIHPGPTSTDFQDDIETRATGLEKAEANEAFDALVPLGRHCTPDEIADAVLFLASGGSVMISRASLSIDGALTN